MHRKLLLTSIQKYKEGLLPVLKKHISFDLEEECRILEKFETFVNMSPECFDREHLPGHITGSALVINKKADRVALTLHKKLAKWLQFGGHSDSDPNTSQVALREVLEESGLKTVTFLPIPSEIKHEKNSHPLPFDFDIHHIPATKGKPEHLHYDVRYLMIADDHKLEISDESIDLRWFDLSEARKANNERSMLRQFDKLEQILSIT